MLRKGLLVIAVPFAFQIVFILALWKAQKDSVAAQNWAMHTKDVIAQTETLARYVTEAQNYVRGRIVTGDASQSAAYESVARRIPGAAVLLRKLVSDNAGQQARADALITKINGLMATSDETHRQALAGRLKEASERVHQVVTNRTAESLRAEIDRFLKNEEALDEARRDRLARAQGAQYWAVIGGALASAATALLTVLAFSRGFARRVAVLGENARKLAQGKTLAAPIGGGDELSQLDSVFHAMAASLAEKDRENEMFIFSVSHDLRSPLVNLQGFSKELTLTCDDLREALTQGGVADQTRQRVDLLLDRDMATSIRFIQCAVTRLSAIIDALLRLSRAGRVEYRWQAVDVASTVARVVDALSATASQRKAEVILAPDLPPTWGDPTAIEQVFANLVGNALNYLDPTRPGRVEIGTIDENPAENPSGSPFITYYVKDNGLGIPRAYQAKLFLAFQRLHPEAAPGEGIGLALVRRVVERHGGKVWFESEEGQGTTFYLTLPSSPGTGRSPDLLAASVNGKQGTQLWPSTR